MARKSNYRWRGWRVEESGRTIRSNPQGDGKRKKRKRRKKRSSKKRRSSPNWWWITSRFDGTCDGCGEPFDEGTKVCWRGEPKRVLCEICADNEGVSAEASLSRSAKPISTQTRRVTAHPCGRQHPDGRCELEAGHEGLCETWFSRGVVRWRHPLSRASSVS